MKTFGGEQSLLGGGGPAGLYADKSVKWLQLVIEVREVVITKNTTSTYALLAIYTLTARLKKYRIAGNIGGDLNLAVWQSGKRPPN